MKMESAIIFHAKYRVAQKSMTLKCLIILYVQVLSCSENWDIRDLTLMGYDTIKTYR